MYRINISESFGFVGNSQSLNDRVLLWSRRLGGSNNLPVFERALLCSTTFCLLSFSAGAIFLSWVLYILEMADMEEYSCRNKAPLGLSSTTKILLGKNGADLCRIYFIKGRKDVSVAILRRAFGFFRKRADLATTNFYFTNLSVELFDKLIFCWRDGGICLPREECGVFEEWAEYLQLDGFDGADRLVGFFFLCVGIN